MRNDFISIFNQLTSNELADYNLFTDVLENHYEKFKFLYSLIEDIDLTEIDSIYCTVKKNNLTTYIKPRELSYINKIIFNINDRRHNYPFSEYFSVDIVEINTHLQISISLSNIKKEDELYANRLI